MQWLFLLESFVVVTHATYMICRPTNLPHLLLHFQSYQTQHFTCVSHSSFWYHSCLVFLLIKSVVYLGWCLLLCPKMSRLWCLSWCCYFWFFVMCQLKQLLSLWTSLPYLISTWSVVCYLWRVQFISGLDCWFVPQISCFNTWYDSTVFNFCVLWQKIKNCVYKRQTKDLCLSSSLVCSLVDDAACPFLWLLFCDSIFINVALGAWFYAATFCLLKALSGHLF